MWQERFIYRPQTGERKETRKGKASRPPRNSFCLVQKARGFAVVLCQRSSICSSTAVGDLCLIKSKSVLPIRHCVKQGTLYHFPKVHLQSVVKDEGGGGEQRLYPPCPGNEVLLSNNQASAQRSCLSCNARLQKRPAAFLLPM